MSPSLVPEGTGGAAAAIRDAAEPADVVATLDRKVDRDATPDIVPSGTPILQPTDERRRSGSHYTPRSLTEPIVAEALRPIFERLGPRAEPEQILDLKVLDPATGSGAFLVEACRQLAARLMEAWSIHGGPAEIPDDEDELLHARRLVAQRCLYGVDRNPMAIDLARMSIWLATFARDHEFTFIDHTLKYGDSLVGLTQPQIEGLDWEADEYAHQEELGADAIRAQLAEASELHRLIREAGSDSPRDELFAFFEEAKEAIARARLLGHLTIAAFFKGKNKKQRKDLLKQLRDAVQRGEAEQCLSWFRDLGGNGTAPLAPFHWEVEFPEVFDRENPGFDAVIGNPPFAGKNSVAASNVSGYPEWLKWAHEKSHGNADLVAHFFRRAFDLLRDGGTFGLIATNTIAQGDTRASGLRWICENDGAIYRATKRVKWPGEAAVVVSVLHIAKGEYEGAKVLDGAKVENITAFLFHRGGHADPARLEANAGKSFVGSYVLGMGFTFDDSDPKGVATPIADMHRLIEAAPRNREAIFPYIGGEEINSSPIHEHHRHVINFRDYPLRREDLEETWEDADSEQRDEWLRKGTIPRDYPCPVADDWPQLLAILEARVKGTRASHSTAPWWQFERPRIELDQAIAGLERVLVISRVSQQAAFAFLTPNMVFAESTIVFPLVTNAAFCVLQARPHEIWARFFSSSLEDRLRYTPSDCFETFPFPEGWEGDPHLEVAGRTYLEHRAAVMIRNDEGMTKTYNRFHDPDEDAPEIAELRALHAAMDRAVLDAYGWNDIRTGCEFVLDHAVEEVEEIQNRRRRPWRYRWPDEVHHDVLMRLLALNAERATLERLSEEQPPCSPRRPDTEPLTVG